MRKKKNLEISDEELERRMEEYFKRDETTLLKKKRSDDGYWLSSIEKITKGHMVSFILGLVLGIVFL